jgi:hypothetical protein
MSSTVETAIEIRPVGTDVVHSMAERAGASITEVEGSHAIIISQPQAVTDVILEAVASSAPEGTTWAGALYDSYLTE